MDDQVARFLLFAAVPAVFFAAMGALHLRVRVIRRRRTRESEHWPTARGRVVASKVLTHAAEISHPARHMHGGHSVEYPYVCYVFDVDGHEYEGDRPSRYDLAHRYIGPSFHALDTVEAYPVGTEVTVRYDPVDPARNCIDAEPVRKSILWDLRFSDLRP